MSMILDLRNGKQKYRGYNPKGHKYELISYL